MERQEPPPNGSPVAIGIDFGTSKCCVAAVRDGRAHVLENEFGQRTTPSWVAFNSQQRLVGGAALDQAVVNCANTVSAVKRTLGRAYDDVKRIPSSCKIKKCCSGCVKFKYCVNYKKSEKFLSPEQIAAMMLTKMKEIAETSLGHPVGKAVISVPACYDNAQRTAVMNAAKVAGLEVLQLINETTAAGIAFEDNRSVKTPVTIAVVDFGAGKLDISVMEVEEKSIKVIGTSGSPFLGGCTIDEVLVRHCIKFIQQKFGNKVKINDKVGVKLRMACEKAKKTLSLLPDAQVCIESIVEDSDVSIPVSRQDISELFDGEIRKTINANFRRIFKTNPIDKHNIDKVVLVGGSTRIPAVKTILEEYFGSHKLDQTVNQDEAVAQGAALRAAALSGAAAGIQVSDVASFDICFSKLNVHNENILIKKFTPLSWIGSFQVNHIRGTKLVFFERTYSFTGSCCDILIGLLELNKSLSSKNNRVTGDVELHLNESGMLDISVFLQDEQSTFRFEPNHFQCCDVNRWMEEEEQFRSDTNEEMKRVDAEVELESLCYDVQNALSKLESIEDISQRELESNRQALSKAMNWMVNDIAAAQLSEISRKISKLLNVKAEIDRKLDTAQKRAAAKEAAKKEQIFAYKLLLSEVIGALQDSDLMRDFYPQRLQQCMDKMSSLMTSKEDIESASMAEISQKLEDLTRVKKEVDQLKVDAAREKTQREAENEAARKREEEKLLETQISEFESLLSDVEFVLHDTIFVTYSDQQIFKACELKLKSLLAWKENSDTASITQVSQKLEKLTELKRIVDQMKTDALKEARGKEDVKKQKELELHKERICTFKYVLSEVKETLNDLYPVRSSYSSKFWSCVASLHLLEGEKAIIETGSVTLVYKKLEELTQLKHEVDQLKNDVERRKSQEIEEVVDATLAHWDSPEQHTGLCNSSSSSPANGQITRNVALNSILENKKHIKRECPLISYNSSSGSVEPSFVASASNHDRAETGRSQSLTRSAMEGQWHHSRNGTRSPSGYVANERRSRVQSGQSLEQFQSSENLKNEHSSLPRSCQNSVDDVIKHRSISRSRKVLVDQNGEPRSSSRSRQPSGSEDIGLHSRTSLNNEEIVGERRHSSRSRQSSEYKGAGHRSRTPHNSKAKEGEQKVPNRERSSSRSLHESANSKDRQPVALCSSSASEHHHQPKASCEGTANKGPYLHGSSDRCTEQPTSARGTGSTLDLMKKYAVVNSDTLPNKLTPWNDVAPSEEYNSTVTCPSKETRTASTTTSETDVAILENNRGCENDMSLNDKLKGLPEEVKENILKIENLGILRPWLEIMNDTTRNIANCKRCTKLGIICSYHHSEGFSKVSRVLNSVTKILSQNSPTKTGEVNVNKPTTATLEPAENVGASRRYTSPNCPKKENGSSNGNVDSAQGPTAVPHQSSTGVSDTHFSVGGSLSTPVGPARVSTSCIPVHRRTASGPVTETRTCNSPTCSCYRSQYSEKTFDVSVHELAAQYEEKLIIK